MIEGGIVDCELVVLVLKQVSGDNVEVIFLLCVYCIMLVKLVVSELFDIIGMCFECCIFVVYKDIFGGQLFGLIYDYIYCLFDFILLVNGEVLMLIIVDSEQQLLLYVFSLLVCQGLVKFEEDSGVQLDDIICMLLVYFCLCFFCLQQLMCGDEGYLLVLVYFI